MSETLGEDDFELVRVAADIIRRRYRDGWHAVGAALRTRSGRVVSGVNLDAYVGRMAVCAEAVGAVAELGEDGVDTIVAARHPELGEGEAVVHVVSPCGGCRELILDYDRGTRVIEPDGGGLAVVKIGDLLPNKYVRCEAGAGAMS
jgi:cytidine deaminase